VVEIQLEKSMQDMLIDQWFAVIARVRQKLESENELRKSDL
jgi:hypothetical protein